MPRLTENGIALNVEFGGSGEPLVLLHGFMGSIKTWADHRPAFEDRYLTVAVDLPGHGLSDAPADPLRYRMERVMADLAAVFDRCQLDSVHLLGYSGGRVAVHFAVAHPDRVRSLVLESALPGLADPAERRARIDSDEALAQRLERDGLAAFVDAWARLPLFASQERLPESIRADLRAQRLQNNVPGLANTLRGLGTGVQSPLWDRLVDVKTPTLLIVGALDAKFVSINRDMVSVMPHAQLVVVRDAGHTVHLEQPIVFDRLVLDHLTKQDARRAVNTAKTAR
jgi:2-succinyl-6-hydroxy-2,4-cyclohexadiene-1-carboxylate synthase